MSKALFGYLGEPRAYMLMNEIRALKTRIAELEKALESSEAEALALRAIADAKAETEQVEALA